VNGLTDASTDGWTTRQVNASGTCQWQLTKCHMSEWAFYKSSPNPRNYRRISVWLLQHDELDA